MTIGGEPLVLLYLVGAPPPQTLRVETPPHQPQYQQLASMAASTDARCRPVRAPQILAARASHSGILLAESSPQLEARIDDG